MPLVLILRALRQPTPTVPTGAVTIVVNTPAGQAAPTAPVAVTVPRLTSGPVMTTATATGFQYYAAAVPPGEYEATFIDGAGLVLVVPFSVFVPLTVNATPPPLAAAHLPMPVVLRTAPPAPSTAPAALLLVVEVLRGTAWQEAGRLREVCDPALGIAEFDISEYVKTQFTDTAPDESGLPDPALGIAYRVRYGPQPGFTGITGEEAGTLTGLAVNAAEVVNPGLDPLPLPIGPVVPYGAVPPGAARFRSTVVLTTAPAGTPTFASDPAGFVYAVGALRVGPVEGATGPQLFARVVSGPAPAPTTVAGDANWRYQYTGPAGVANLPAVPEAATECAARQFVWLTRRGAWAWGQFSGRHEHGTDAGDDALVRRSGGDFYVGGGDVRPTLRVYSDRLDFATFLVLREVRRSRRVYERLASGQYVPVLVEKGSFPDYKETDKVFDVNFAVRYPVLTVQTF